MKAQLSEQPLLTGQDTSADVKTRTKMSNYKRWLTVQGLISITAIAPTITVPSISIQCESLLTATSERALSIYAVLLAVIDFLEHTLINICLLRKYSWNWRALIFVVAAQMVNSILGIMPHSTLTIRRRVWEGSHEPCWNVIHYLASLGRQLVISWAHLYTSMNKIFYHWFPKGDRKKVHRTEPRLVVWW